MSSSSSDPPAEDLDLMSAEDLIVMILFGRYQENSGIASSKIILAVILIFFTFLIYAICLRRRLKMYDKIINDIPRDTLEILNTKRTQFQQTVMEMSLVQTILADELKPESSNSEGLGDPSWAKLEHKDKKEEIHHNAVIASSFLQLEKTARARRPHLLHRNSRSIREFVKKLQFSFPALREDLCREYIETYETSVFGSHAFNSNDYKRLEEVIGEMCSLINDIKVDATEALELHTARQKLM